MPLAFAAVAQAIVVISGGIDLSIGSMMALTSVTAALLMKDQSAEFAIPVVLGVLVLGLVLGVINGTLVVITRVPDIVVTLAMSFVWAGAALLVLNSPGGGSADWLTGMVKGPLGLDILPRALVVLLVIVGVIWLPLRRSTAGLALYAIGSNRLAAFRSGVAVGRTKVFAYTLGGLFSAFGGLALTATTGIGTPVNRPDAPRRELQPVDRRPGRHPHRGRDVRQPAHDAAGADMTAQAGMVPGSGTVGLAERTRRLLRDRPLIPLTALLVLLVVLMQVAQPGVLTQDWVGSTIRAAIPLAILAAAQTLAMLTGGIDLSVGTVASMAGFIMATQTGSLGPGPAIALALLAALVAGIANGIGVGVFKVHPLIMTLGIGLVILGLMNVYQLMVVTAGTNIPPIVDWLGSGTTLDWLPNNLFLFIPLAAVIILGLRYSGYGRLLFAVGDNAVAARLAGVRVWQVHLALYIIAALLAAIAGMLVAGLVKTASLALAESLVLPSVAAAVIGGTSIMGGRGGYSGTIVGALILTVLTSLLIAVQMPEAVRQILFGAIIVVVAAVYTRIVDVS
jgi:ribose transport system permease protein